MKIELKDFGGIIPGTDPTSLPDNAAQIAQNVDLSAGTIKPWRTTNNFSALHTADRQLADGFLSDDIAILPKAEKVVMSEKIKMCHPEEFIEIKAYFYAFYFDCLYVMSGTPVGSYKGSLLTASFQISDVEYTDTGFKLKGDFGTTTVQDLGMSTLQDLAMKSVTGVTFRDAYITDVRISISVNSTKLKAFCGGPESGSDRNLADPDKSVFNEESFDSPLCQLFFPNEWDGYNEGDTYNSETSEELSRYQYGTLSLIDSEQLPKTFDRIYSYEHYSSHVISMIDKADRWFEFSCDYTRNTRQQLVYIQQSVDAVGRDGPESDESDIMTLNPGEVLKLDPSVISGYDHFIFRAAYGSTDFYKIGESEGGYFYDDYMRPMTDQLPPNGALPFATVSSAVRGAVKHPAGYAVYFSGNELRPSSEWIERERPWTTPEEYAYAFDSSIQRIALSGGTILVFTEKGVFTATGQHPARLSIYRISDKPMLNRLSLWQSGNMVGWVNEEGLCVYDGGSETLLTGEYYRADEWQLLNPAAFEAKVNDRSICLFGNDARFRFDLRGDRIRAISLFDEAEENRREFRWRSKIFQTLPVSWYAARIDAVSYPVLLSLHGDDGKTSEDVLVMDDNDFLLPRMPKSRTWFFELRGESEIRSVAIATNRKEL